MGVEEAEVLHALRHGAADVCVLVDLDGNVLAEKLCLVVDNLRVAPHVEQVQQRTNPRLACGCTEEDTRGVAHQARHIARRGQDLAEGALDARNKAAARNGAGEQGENM